MQNKPKLLDAQMNASSGITKHYEDARLRGREKNKPNQTQFYPVRLSQDKKVGISNGARRQKCLTG